MPVAAKGAWVVTAGVIPGERRKEFTKRWDYTSLDDEADSHIKDLWEVPRFRKLRAEAMDYFEQISNPRINNWAKIEFIWF